MDDVTEALWLAERDSAALGRVIRGLGVLATRYEELWLIVEGQRPDRVASKDIGFSLGGIMIGGRLLVPFCNVKDSESESGNPCVSFEMAGKDAMFAPTTTDGGDWASTVLQFLTNDRYSEDTVYLTSLDGVCGDRVRCRELKEEEIDLLRAPDEDAAAKELLPTDILRVLGEDMRIGDITWAERDSDGDGNRYLHLVMSDGRYRRVSVGDLGR